MQEKLQQLKAKIARIADINGASSVLGWDQQVKMPDGGAKARADQVSTLRLFAHELFTSDEIGRLLDDLAPYAESLDADSDDARMILVTKREYDKSTKVPSDLVAELAKVRSLSAGAWRNARANNDFDSYAPLLEQMTDLQIKRAECFAPYDNIYDVMLDNFEPGLNVDNISAIFDGMKPPLIYLVKAITANADAVDGDLKMQFVPHDKQMAFSTEVATALGYDFNRGRIDLAPHPFTSSSSYMDVRLTTRIDENNPMSGLMASIHEAGHGIHRQSSKPEYYRTMLVGAASAAVAESQSRFYELMLGQGRAFWRYMYPKMQEAFAPAFADIQPDDFYRSLNLVTPSLIRVGADEVTYGLHIILRFELENDLVNGRVSVADLPAEWNARMEQYLGIVPPTDSDGVLQDVHWSMGLFGYFPDYQLGSMFAVQLWNAMLDQHPGIEAEIEAGQFGTILTWLQDNIMAHGVKYTLPELAKRAVGAPLQWEPYIDYLKTKYTDIYRL